MSEIRSSIEAIDSVVRNFANDIDTFKSDVSDKMNNIDSAMARLSNCWEGSLYTNFEEKMRMKQSEIRSSLARAGNLKDKLDEQAAQMAAMLEFLRQSGED